VGAIQVRGGLKADKELAVRRVGVASPRGSDRPALEGRGGEFSGEIWIFRTACPVPFRIAGLSHKAGNNPMKRKAIIKPFLYQCLNALNVLRREIRPKLDNDAAVFQIQIESVLRASGAGGDYSEYRCEDRHEKAGTQHGIPLLLIAF